MGKYIAIGIVVVIAVIPHIIRFLFFNMPAITDLKNELFACPNCGNHFHAKWYQLHRFARYAIYTFNQTNLKCPNCGIKDMCSRTNSR